MHFDDEGYAWVEVEDEFHKEVKATENDYPWFNFSDPWKYENWEPIIKKQQELQDYADGNYEIKWPGMPLDEHPDVINYDEGSIYNDTELWNQFLTPEDAEHVETDEHGTVSKIRGQDAKEYNSNVYDFVKEKKLKEQRRYER